MSDDDRREAIRKIYRELLNREADVPGLEGYFHSSMSLDQIRKNIAGSYEYSMNQRSNNFKGEISKSNYNEEKLLMGASPRETSHIEDLQDVGVEAILNVDDALFVDYDTSWCSQYLQVPLPSSGPLTVAPVKQCLDFLYDCIKRKGLKTFVHSKEGLLRAPSVVVFYLVSMGGFSLEDALRLVLSKHNSVDIPRSFITSEVLQNLLSYREGVSKGAVDELKTNVFSISENLFGTTVLTQFECLDVRNKGIEVVIDINPPGPELSKEVEWFNVVKLPVSYSGDSSDFHKSVDALIRNVNKLYRKGKKIVIYGADEVALSAICMCYLISTDLSLDKSSWRVKENLPIIASINLVKSWQSSKV